MHLLATVIRWLKAKNGPHKGLWRSAILGLALDCIMLPILLATFCGAYLAFDPALNIG